MFRLVTRQMKRAVRAVKSVLAVAGTAAAVVDPKLQTYLQEGEKLDGLASIQIAMARWIEDDHEHLERLEKAHRATLRRLRQLRRQRDEHQATLYTRMIRIRTTHEEAFGQGTAAIYLGLEPGLIELEPEALRRNAWESVEILSNPELRTPPAVVEGIWDNPLSYAEQIRTALEPFETTLDEIESQQKAVEVALKAKTEHMNEVKPRLTWLIRFFEAIFHLAGEGFHAERLRIAVSSRSSADEPQAEDEPSGDEPSGDDVTPDVATAEASSQSEASA